MTEPSIVSCGLKKNDNAETEEAFLHHQFDVKNAFRCKPECTRFNICIKSIRASHTFTMEALINEQSKQMVTFSDEKSND